MDNLKETVNAVVNSRYPEMNQEGRELLETVLVRRELEKGEMLLNEGQISRNMVFVGKGMMRQFYYKNGKDVTEHFSYEGCILMCIESMLNSLIVSQIKADSWRFETARERYNLLLHHHPEIVKRAPLSHIASYLLMTPETLSRVRSGVL